jgi:hypothetical protein
MAQNALGAPYMDAAPSEIYIGMKCEELKKKELFDIAYELDIPYIGCILMKKVIDMN